MRRTYCEQFTFIYERIFIMDHLDLARAIKSYVNRGSFRDVKFQRHVSGVRVTLSDNFKDLCSVVASTASAAFQEALDTLPTALERRHAERIKEMSKEIEELTGKLSSKKSELARLKKEKIA
jgi:hypothetical protein